MKPRTILVVEDNPIARKMARVTLEAEGYRVIEAEDGAEALAAVEAGAPDLILQDIKLPDVNGVDLLPRIRALPNGQSVPVIALTGFRSELEYARSATAGFTEILFKPVEPSMLARIIRAHLQPAPTPQVSTAPRPRLLLVDDDGVQLKLGGVLLAAAGYDVRTARDGVEALERAREWTPEVVVSDILMPRLDGFRFCAALREDPALGAVPVVLTSSAFLAREDRQLAAQMGAHALIARTPDYGEILTAVREAMAGEPRLPGASPAPASVAGYAERAWHQLEQQIQLNASLSQRLAQRRAEIAILTAATDAITAGQATGDLTDVLQHGFNACGVSRGAVYVLQAEGGLTLDAMVGYDEGARPEVAAFFGRGDLLRGALTASAPGVVAGAPGGLDAVVLTALRRGTEAIGVFWMEVDAEAASPLEWLPFAAAVGGQLAQAITLRRVYAEAAEGREATRREELRRQQLQIKDQFLSHVSHELRTPLTAIHQFVSILLDGLAGPVAPEQREYLEIAFRNVNELRTMIDALLEATRSETARLSIEARPIRLADVIGDVLASLGPSARQKRVTLSSDVSPVLPPGHADPARVGQIISNLVGNAIKFTPEGGSVTVQAVVAPDERGMLRVSVTDTGPGIPRGEWERIFEYLYQGKNSAELTRRGFGIGLHLCRELVTRQGGRIWVESEPGRGSVFLFTVPASEVGAAHAA